MAEAKVQGMRARRLIGEAVGTLAKAAIALAVFSVVMVGWSYLQVRQARAFTAMLPLPDRTEQDRCAIWFIGSSTMSRWTSLQDDMQPWSTHNRSIGGATLDELGNRFRNEEHPQPPRAIVFYAGENDLAFGVPVPRAVASFQRFMDDKRRAMGAVPVFFLSIKPSPTRWDGASDQDAYDAAVRAIAARSDDLAYVNTRARFLVDGRPGPYYGPDGLHLNARGYRIFADAVQRALDGQLPPGLVRECRRIAAAT